MIGLQAPSRQAVPNKHEHQAEHTTQRRVGWYRAEGKCARNGSTIMSTCGFLLRPSASCFQFPGGGGGGPAASGGGGGLGGLGGCATSGDGASNEGAENDGAVKCGASTCSGQCSGTPRGRQPDSQSVSKEPPPCKPKCYCQGTLSGRMVLSGCGWSLPVSDAGSGCLGLR